MKISQLRKIIREELEVAFSGQTTDEWDFNKPVELPWEDAIPGEALVSSGGYLSEPCETPDMMSKEPGPINAKALILKTKLIKPSAEIIPVHEDGKEERTLTCHHCGGKVDPPAGLCDVCKKKVQLEHGDGEEVTGQEEYQDEQADGRILKLERIVYKLAKRKNKV